MVKVKDRLKVFGGHPRWVELGNWEGTPSYNVTLCPIKFQTGDWNPVRSLCTLRSSGTRRGVSLVLRLALEQHLDKILSNP